MYSRNAPFAFALTALSGGFLFGCESAQPAPSGCKISPATLTRDFTLEDGRRPPVVRELPDSGGAASTWITPAPRYRWAPKVGLVETVDGSLLLHGVTSRAGTGPSHLSVVVLVDYAPAQASIRVWSPTRDALQVRVGAKSTLRAEIDGAAAAFDIELPVQSVAIGHWREVETIIALDGEVPDVRRWTLYRGPQGPAVTTCANAAAGVEIRGGRSQLSPTGEFSAQAPHATTIAVVPLGDDASAGPAKFVRFDAPRAGYRADLGPSTRVAAVWEDPFSGPGASWISNFWTAAARSANVQAASGSDVR